METQRITISIPTHIYNQVKDLVKKRQLSKFVADAVEEKILSTFHLKNEDPIDRFLALREKYPLYKTSKEIKEAINKGRL